MFQLRQAHPENELAGEALEFERHLGIAAFRHVSTRMHLCLTYCSARSVVQSQQGSHTDFLPVHAAGAVVRFQSRGMVVQTNLTPQAALTPPAARLRAVPRGRRNWFHDGAITSTRGPRRIQKTSWPVRGRPCAAHESAGWGARAAAAHDQCTTWRTDCALRPLV